MVHSVKGLTKIYKAGQYSILVSATGIEFSVDEIEHLYEIVVDGATRKSAKLVNINVVLDVWPDPLYKKPLQSLAKEGSKSEVS